jgi:hypothetical protein
MAYLREVFQKKQIKWAIVSFVFLLAALIVTALSVRKANSLTDQNISRRWSDDNDYTSISVFISELADIRERDVQGYYYGIKAKLTEESLINDDDAGRKLVQAYSSVGETQIVSNTGSVKVTTLGVGGDFFLFHPVKLVSGNYFSGDEVMKDKVILDKNAAFSLFGSYDIVGQMVEIGGIRHIVAGVAEEDTGYLQKLSGMSDSIAYVSYDTLCKYGTDRPIDVYEVLLPNPVGSFGKKIVEEVVAIDEGKMEIIENAGRFKFYKLLMKVPSFPIRSMNLKGVVYPYWENVARGVEGYLMMAALVGTFLYLVPIVYLIYIVSRMWKMRTIHIRDIKQFVDNLIDAHRRKEYFKEDENEEDN